MASRGDRSPFREQRGTPRRSIDDPYRSKGESSSHDSSKYRSSRKGETWSPSPERPTSRAHRESHYREREGEEYERRRHHQPHARGDDQRRGYDDFSNEAHIARLDEYDRRRTLDRFSHSRAREEDPRHSQSDLHRESSSRDYYESRSTGYDYWRQSADREDERGRSRYEDEHRDLHDRDMRAHHNASSRYRDDAERSNHDKTDRYRHRSQREVERDRSARPSSRELEEARHRDKERRHLASSKNQTDADDFDKIKFRSRREEESQLRGAISNGHKERDGQRKEREGTKRDERDHRTGSSVRSTTDSKAYEDRHRRDSDVNGKIRSRRKSTPTEDDIFEKLSSKNKKIVTEAETQSKGAERRYSEMKKQSIVEDEKRATESNLNLSNGHHHKGRSDQNGILTHQSAETNTSQTSKHITSQGQNKPVPRKTLVDRVLTSPTPPPSSSVSRAAETSRPAPAISGRRESVAVAPIETPLSFSLIKLPHELLEAGNESLIPLRADGKRLLPYRVTYDPKLDKSGKGKELIRTTDIKGAARDPRKDRVPRRPARKQVHTFAWAWDQQSTKLRPPPPPSAICISHLSPLITMTQIKQLFRNFGRIDKADLKLDPRTGESLGVAYIQFAQDYDEEGNLKEEARDMGNDQRGDHIAKKVMEEQGTIRIGEGKDFKLVLDDEGQSKYVKECREAMERKHGAKAKTKASDDLSKPSMTGKDVVSSPATPMLPPPSGPKALRQQMAAAGLQRAGPSAMNSYRSGYGISPKANIAMQRSYASGQGIYHNDYHQSRSSFDASPVVRSPLHTSDEKDTLLDTNTILAKLAEVGNPYLFIQRSPYITSQLLFYHFQAFLPLAIYADHSGWYMAFNSPLSASKAIQFVGKIEGVRLAMSLQSRPSPPSKPQVSLMRHPTKTSWENKETLSQDAGMLILRQLGREFMREYRARDQRKFVADFVKGTGKIALQAAIKADEAQEAQDSDSDEEDVATSTVSGDRVTESVETSDYASTKETEVSALATDVDEESPIQTTKKGRKSKKVIKESLEEQAVDEAMVIDVEVEDIKSKPIAAKPKPKGRKKQAAKEKSPALDPFVLGVAEDEEDLYFVQLALSKLREGQSITDIESDAMATIESMEEDSEMMKSGVNGLPRNTTGSARTQGYKRIAPAEKALHLPDRNRAIVDPTSAVGMASARDNRADSRRFVQGIEQHKKETATDTDILKFNQLRSRKKQLKFAKSPIHDWGLYAMELIPAGDMVIEYVGEIVRQQVADQREKNYERQGNFSTYLFRVDDDVVVDATKKGNIARLMNHCCTPNCNAKILTLNGEKRIVLFAQKAILPGQELTYDYKFQGTGDEEDAIACLCGSAGCRRFL